MNRGTLIVRRSALSLALVAVLTGCGDKRDRARDTIPTDAEPSVVFHTTAAFKEKGYPFSEAVEAGGFVFLSGQIGTDPETAELVEGGIEPQARQTMENIKASLGRLDLAFADVVKCTVMIDDMADWPAFNTVYAEYFDGDFPARSAFGADGLALGAAVEVECIAKR
ncbi:MAG: ribonuclease [Erythrobacter sp.]|nr:ribonuclease [Erythrobacter sp.]